ncbi:hypothetical protein AOQ84DRAFT_368126, partial [Glonium stellatum]
IVSIAIMQLAGDNNILYKWPGAAKIEEVEVVDNSAAALRQHSFYISALLYWQVKKGIDYSNNRDKGGVIAGELGGSRLLERAGSEAGRRSSSSNSSSSSGSRRRRSGGGGRGGSWSNSSSGRSRNSSRGSSSKRGQREGTRAAGDNNI